MAAKRLTRAALRQRVRAMAREIADDLIELLESHGMWDEASREQDDPGAKRVRRSDAALDVVCGEVMDLLRHAKEPLAISAIADSLGLGRREVAHPLSLLCDEGKLERAGERRGARYRLAGRRTAPKTVRPSKTVRPPKKGSRERSTGRKG